MARLTRAEYEERLGEIRLLAVDVDGVLTDGGIVYIEDDREAKVFCVRDGSAVFLARLIGVQTAIITARNSKVVGRRFAELPVDYLRQGAKNKVSACVKIQDEAGVAAHEVAYIGDDLIDLPLLEHVGLSITVADGDRRLIDAVDWVVDARGGKGAMREVVDDLVGARGKWDDVLDDYRRRQTPGDDAEGAER